MEVNAKGGEWGGGQQDEGGGSVGRKKGGGWVEVGRSNPKNTWGQGGKNKIDKKIVVRGKKKTELGKKI